MSNCKPIQDPETGFMHASQRDFLRAIGMSRNLLNSRRRRGMPESLVLFPGSLKLTSSKDHENNEFESITAMCRHWKISRKLYLERIRCGWTIKRALTTPAGKYRQQNIVFEGRVFNTVRELASYLHLNENTVKSRLRYGWSLSELRMSPASHNGHKRQKKEAV